VDEQEKEAKNVVVLGGRRGKNGLAALAIASMVAGGPLAPILRRQQSAPDDVETRIARAGVEAQLAKEAIAAADAKRERKRLKRLEISKRNE
jgi:hypothetical protein